MTVQGDPVPNPPQHDPVVEEKESGMGRFSRSWMQWLLLLRSKINVINALLVQLSQLTGQGFLSLFDGNFFTRSFQGPMSVQILNGDGSTGDPDFRLKGDEASPPNLSVYGVDYLGVQKFFRPPLFESTGVLNGGTLSIDPGNLTFSISAVSVGMTDYTVPLVPVRTTMLVPASSGLSVPNIAVIATWVGIQMPGGTVVMQSSPFTATQSRTITQLGAVISDGTTSLIAVNNLPSVMRAGINQLQDFMAAVGPINKSGNVISPNGANLNINKSAGVEYKQGANFANNVNDPHNLMLASLTPANFNYRLSTGTQFATTNAIDPNNWENPLGALTNILGANRFTIQRIYVFTSNLIRIQYGQVLYGSLAAAEASLTTESFVTETNIAENGLLLAFLIIRDGTVDLTDTTRAKFIPASKFGGAVGSGGTTITNTDSLPEGLVNLYFTDARAIAAVSGSFQPLDATLSALAAANWAANALPIGTGVDTLTQTVFAANTFPARSSVGNLVAKPITDFAFTILDDINGAAVVSTIGAEPAIPLGTSSQFFRGDKVMTNEIFTDFLITSDNAGSGLIATRYSNNNIGFQFRGLKSRGTLAAPLGVLSGDTIIGFQGRTQFTTAGVPSGFTGNIGDMQLSVLEPHTDVARGTGWSFSVTQLGSTTRADRLRILYTGVDPVSDNLVTLGLPTARWSNAYIVNTNRYGSLFDTGIVSMPSLAADTNDWVITNLANVHIVRCGATGAARTLTGIAGFGTGQRVRLVNITPLDLILAHDNVGSAVGNRFACPNSASFTLNGNDSVELWQDATTNRIRVLGV